MIRLLALLTAVLVVLVMTENHLQRRRAQSWRQAGTVRPLVDLAGERLGIIGIELGDRRWIYVRRAGAWRYPGYFDAFVQVERMNLLLSGLLQSYCTPVSQAPGDLARFGLDPPQALRVTLGDPAGRPLVEVRLGRGTPAPTAREAYAQRAGSDTLFHLHANPRLALDNLVHPLVDPRVLPGGLGLGTIVEVSFAGQSSHPLERLARGRMTVPPGIQLPGMPPQTPVYEWLGVFAGQQRTCLTANAEAYVDFLRRLRYAALHPPGAYAATEEDRALYLTDHTGRIDTLQVSGRELDGHTLLRLRPAGLVMTIPRKPATLLFPAPAALLDSLPRPSPYQLAEPGPPF